MLWCVYHKTQPMRVVDEEGFKKALASGEWFDSPLKVNNEVPNEKRKRKRKDECGEQLEQRICEGSSNAVS